MPQNCICVANREGLKGPIFWIEDAATGLAGVEDEASGFSWVEDAKSRWKMHTVFVGLQGKWKMFARELKVFMNWKMTETDMYAKQMLTGY